MPCCKDTAEIHIITAKTCNRTEGVYIVCFSPVAGELELYEILVAAGVTISSVTFTASYKFKMTSMIW